MPRFIDLDRWKRKQHFDFFKGFDNPFFNLCTDLDVTALVAWCRRKERPSFFLASLFCSLTAANRVEEFRYRIRGDRVLIHPVIHGGSTVLMADDTFRFAYFDYRDDLAAFAAAGERELEAVRGGDGLLRPRVGRDDLIHHSVIPWVRFTSFAHARRADSTDSVPKIVFGRYSEKSGRQTMPISVAVHHSLADGLHVGRFLDGFQELLARPDEL